MSPQSDRTLDCWEPTRCTSDINFISLTQLQTLHLQYISLKSWYSERDNKNDGLQFITVENVTVLWFPFKNFIPVITLELRSWKWSLADWVCVNSVTGIHVSLNTSSKSNRLLSKKLQTVGVLDLNGPYLNHPKNIVWSLWFTLWHLGHGHLCFASLTAQRYKGALLSLEITWSCVWCKKQTTPIRVSSHIHFKSQVCVLQFKEWCSARWGTGMCSSGEFPLRISSAEFIIYICCLRVPWYLLQWQSCHI